MVIASDTNEQVPPAEVLPRVASVELPDAPDAPDVAKLVSRGDGISNEYIPAKVDVVEVTGADVTATSGSGCVEPPEFIRSYKRLTYSGG